MSELDDNIDRFLEEGRQWRAAHPMSTRVIRITDESDGEFVQRMYSYWPNAVILDGTAFVFAGHVDGLPRFFQVDLTSGTVTRLGALIGYGGTTEGWYWDAAGQIMLCDGPRLRRVNPFSGRDDVLLDISETHPWCQLWQAHSSDDGQTHSATVQQLVEDGAYPNIGTVVFWQGRQEYYPARGTLDESQITPDGGWLVIKEDDDNRIITLETHETRMLLEDGGAVGHSDCGPGLLVGEYSDATHGECVVWDLRKPLTPGNRLTLFQTWNMGYVSVRGDRCLHSDATHLNLLALDGSSITPLIAHGNVGDDYDHRVKANLSPCGRVACYMANGIVYLLEL